MLRIPVALPIVDADRHDDRELTIIRVVYEIVEVLRLRLPIYNGQHSCSERLVRKCTDLELRRISRIPDETMMGVT